MKKVVLLVTLVCFCLSIAPVVGNAQRAESGDYEYDIVKDGAVLLFYHGEGGHLEIPAAIDGVPLISVGHKGEYMPGIDAFATSEVTSISLPDTLKYIGDGAFSGMTVKTIDIPDGVTYIGNSAFRSSAITEIKIPDGVTYIGGDAFAFCDGLTTATIPESVTEYGNGAFYWCKSLASATVLGEKIGDAMFYGCDMLSEVSISNNVRSIGEGAFAACPVLKTLYVPSSVTSIGYDAFLISGIEDIVIGNQNATFEEETNYDFGMFPKGPTFERCENLKAIYAFQGSQAKSFAQKNGIKFTPIANVQLNGQPLELDAPAIIDGDRVLVPMRAIFEELGASVAWDDATQTATVTKNMSQPSGHAQAATQAPALANARKIVSVSVGSRTMRVDGKAVTLDVAPQTVLDRTLVPVRAVCESLGATVSWDAGTQTVSIVTGNA